MQPYLTINISPRAERCLTQRRIASKSEYKHKSRCASIAVIDVLASCKVTCEYSGAVKETYNSLDGQDCDDVGMKSIGNCDNGVCRLSLE